MSNPEPEKDCSDDIEWDDEALEAPSCDLENPDICESCT